MYVVVSIILLPGNVLQTRYDDDTGKCRSEYVFNEKAFTDFMSCFGTFLFVIDHALPIFLFITLYTKTILTIRQRQAKPLWLTCQPSRILDKANIQLTRTAIVVTIVFSICMGWESWYYMLSTNGIVTYEKDTWQSVCGAFLAAFNSCTNPFIYSAALPIFRKSLKKTVKFQRLDGQETRSLDTRNRNLDGPRA